MGLKFITLTEDEARLMAKKIIKVLIGLVIYLKLILPGKKTLEEFVFL